VKKF
jgi:hypothetical protein